jgi:hypothetical protein
VVYPIIYRVSTIQGGAGFLPSTVGNHQSTILLLLFLFLFGFFVFQIIGHAILS